MNTRNSNDLGRIGTTPGPGSFTLPLLIVAVPYLMVYFTSKRKNYHWKFIAGTCFFTVLILRPGSPPIKKFEIRNL